MPGSVVALLIAPLLVAGPDPSRCSKPALDTPLFGQQALFRGTATEDTVLAGPGAVRYREPDGGAAAAGPHGIFGQRVRLTAIGRMLAGRLPEGTTEVVVVAWDYDGLCEPLRREGSAPWVPPGTDGLYIASLRAEEHWVTGIPTLDLHNPALPYTGTRLLSGMRWGVPVDSLLTPAELFELYEAMPTGEEVRVDGAPPSRRWSVG